MNRIFQPSADAVLFRLSNAAERHKGGNGEFKVIFQSRHEKTFSSLLDAFLFYISIDEEADLLDMNAGETLIERKVKICLN
jgi:hypothetical protein